MLPQPRRIFVVAPGGNPVPTSLQNCWATVPPRAGLRSVRPVNRRRIVSTKPIRLAATDPPALWSVRFHKFVGLQPLPPALLRERVVVSGFSLPPIVRRD